MLIHMVLKLKATAQVWPGVLLEFRIMFACVSQHFHPMLLQFYVAKWMLHPMSEQK